MSLILLMIMGLVAAYSSQTTIVEQKISSNHYRSKQAFEAAQAGLDAVISRLQRNFVINSTQNGSIANNNSFTQAGITLPSLSTAGSDSQSVGSYSLEITTDQNNADIIDITVHGFSGDNQTSIPNKTLHQRLIATPIIHNTPPTPLIAKKMIRIGNQVSISNKTNSNTGVLPKAIWSGESTVINFEGITATIDVVSNDGTLDGGNGIYENDQTLNNLSNEYFFQNFFSENKETIKSRATIIDCSANCTGQELLNNGQAIATIIWVDTNINSSNPGQLNISDMINLGNSTQPVILIVDGKFTMNNRNSSINGIIYTTQDFSNADGNGNINGSLITEGSVHATGELNITYQYSQLLTLKNNTSRYIRIAGSWRDF